jgi:hypothetical protein
MWTWDGGGDVHDPFWEGRDGEGAIRRALSPRLNPDPCAPGAEMATYPNLAFGKPTKASAVNGPQFAGRQAVDLSMHTQWNAGGGAPQWLQIDLERPSDIAAIRLVVAQEPEGMTVHRVLGKGESGDFHLLHEFHGVTHDGQVLEYAPPEAWSGIRIVRIETEESPSWVGWTEVQVLAPTTAAGTPLAATFAGTWEGPDPDDGSLMTIVIAQSGSALTATFSDTKSGSVPPPGYEGSGTGTVLSATTGQMTFHLTRHDGAVADLALNLELSGQDTLTMTSGPPAAPWILTRE